MKFANEIEAKASSMSNYLVVVSHGAFSFVVLSTLFDVFLRYVADRPILGVIELNQCMMPIMVFMAVGLTQQMKGHIRVTLVVNRFKEEYQIFFAMAAYILGFCICLLFGWQTWLNAIKALKTNESVLLGINEMPIWWAKFSIPIGFWSLALQCLLDFLASLKRITTKDRSAEA